MAKERSIEAANRAHERLLRERLVPAIERVLSRHFVHFCHREKILALEVSLGRERQREQEYLAEFREELEDECYPAQSA